MKWMLTDQVPALVAGLRAAGHEVEVAPVAKLCDFDNYDNPKDYPLGAIVRGSKPDALILVNPIRWLESGEQFAFWTGHVHAARQLRITGVMLALNDPWTWNQYANRKIRACGARPSSVHIYASRDRDTAVKAAAKGRAAWWDGSTVSRLVEAVEHAKRGTGYSPRRDGRNWL